LDSHDGEDQPEKKTDQQDIEDGRDCVHQCVYNDLTKDINPISYSSHLTGAYDYQGTNTFIPCHLDMARRGLKALRVLRAFKAAKFLVPVPVVSAAVLS
jgi:hypothetical protein